LNLVLASKSPRRAELLAAAGIEFTVRVADIDETPREFEPARDYVLRVAKEKAHAVEATADEIVLAADTTVVLAGQILGKPEHVADAARMLRSLAGKRHEVMTGVCMRHEDRLVAELATTAVWFNPMTQSEIDDYVASGEPMDKAGAYGIQGLASKFIERIDGSYSNVVGLPVGLVWRFLKTISARS
jgi:septum formation protein